MPNFVQVEEVATKAANELVRTSSTFGELATSLSQQVTKLLSRTPHIPRDSEFETSASIREFLRSPSSGRETFGMAFPRQTTIAGENSLRIIKPQAAFYSSDANIYRLGHDQFIFASPTTSKEHLRVEEWNGDRKKVTYAKTLSDDLSVDIPTLRMASGAYPKPPSLSIEIGNTKGLSAPFEYSINNRIATLEGSSFNIADNFAASPIARQEASKPLGVDISQTEVAKVLRKSVKTPMGDGYILGIDDKTGEALVRLSTWPMTRAAFPFELNPRESYAIGLNGELAFRDLEGHVYGASRPMGPLEKIDGIGVFRPAEVSVKIGSEQKQLDYLLGVKGYRPVGIRAAGGYYSENGSLVKLQV